MPAISLPTINVLIDEYIRRFGSLDSRVSRVAVRFGANRQLAELMLCAIEANQPPDLDAFALALTGLTLAKAYDSRALSDRPQASVIGTAIVGTTPTSLETATCPSWK